MRIQQLLTATICCLWFGVQNGSAQQYMWVVDDSGNILGIKVDTIEQSTFQSNSSWIDFVDHQLESLGPTSFSASFKISTQRQGIKNLFNINFVDPEIGVCYTTDERKAYSMTIADDHKKADPRYYFFWNESHTYSFSDLTSGTTYYIRPYIKIFNDVFYGPVYEVTTL